MRKRENGIGMKNAELSGEENRNVEIPSMGEE